MSFQKDYTLFLSAAVAGFKIDFATYLQNDTKARKMDMLIKTCMEELYFS